MFTSPETKYLELSKKRRALIHQLKIAKSKEEKTQILTSLFAVSEKLLRLKPKVSGNIRPVVW